MVPIDWRRVGLELIQIGVGIALIFAGSHGASFGDGATTTAGAILVGYGVRGLSNE